jgi:phosphate-selective porin OprO and OprP
MTKILAIRKTLTTFLVSFSSVYCFAQNLDTQRNDVKLENLPYYSYGKGVGLTSPDSIFQFNIRFRMQNRVSYLNRYDSNPIIDGQIRRLRLRFDGFVGSPKFLYVIQLSFAPGDVGEIEEGENINIIRDAAVIYRPNTHWNFIFGQTKLPGNRQRINSSGALQFTDRTINNARFNIDRDFGFQCYYLNQEANRFSYNLKTAISTGEGRNFTQNNDNQLAYTAKLELMPFGSFTNDGANFEGDLVREKKPKLFISPAISINNRTKKTAGQLGSELFEPRTLTSFFTDVMLKYNGWSFMYSHMRRNTKENPITFNAEDRSQSNFVWVGQGNDYQASYLFRNNFEVISRFSDQKAFESITDIAPLSKQFSVGLTRYFWEHAFKVQSEIGIDQSKILNQKTEQGILVRFQVEMGI